MRKMLAVAMLSAFSFLYAAAGNIVDSVDVSDVFLTRNGTKFKIEYDLSMSPRVEWCRVRLYVSDDGGLTFKRQVQEQLLTGDIGVVSSSGHKVVEYDFSGCVEEFVDRKIAFRVSISEKHINRSLAADGRPVERVKAPVTSNAILAFDMSVYPNLTYGFMLGFVKKAGLYLKLRSDFKVFESNSYTKELSKLNVTGGLVIRGTKWLYPYLGLGYGTYLLDYDNGLERLQGLSLDAGLMFKMGCFTLFGGVSNTGFKYTEAEVGVGFMF